MVRDVASRLRLKPSLPYCKGKATPGGQGCGFSLEIETLCRLIKSWDVFEVVRDVASRLRLKPHKYKLFPFYQGSGQGCGFSLEIETDNTSLRERERFSWSGMWLLA